MDEIYTFEDIADAIGALRRHILGLSKTEYTGDDKELLEQVCYELEKARNVIE